MVQSVNRRVSDDPAPHPAQVPVQFRMQGKVDKAVHDQRSDQNSVRNMEKGHRRYEEQDSNEGLCGMNAQDSQEIHLGRGMMQAMHVPEQRRVPDAMHP